MILNLISAFLFVIAAYCWNRRGWMNVALGASMLAAAMLNVAAASPLLMGWLQ